MTVKGLCAAIAVAAALVDTITVPTAKAAVLCQKKSGALFVRAAVCKRKETSVTAPSIGAVGPQGSQGLQGLQGVSGPAGPGAMWALVESNGSISQQSGGITAVLNATGEFYVTFPASLDGKLILATQVWRSGNGLNTGSILTARCGGGTTGGVNCVVQNNVNTAYVQTNDNTNTTEANRAFYVTVIQ